MENKNGHTKMATFTKDGNESAIDKLADFCDSHSLFKSDEQLSLSFESLFVDSHSAMLASFRQQLPTDLASLRELLPTLYEAYTQLVVEANENELDHATQSDSSNRLYASLKRHPE